MTSSADQRGWGPGWPHDNASKCVVVRAAVSGTALLVRAEVAPIVKWLIDETERRGYLLDHGPTDPTDDWGFANRPIAGTRVPSNHSWGLAVDLDATKYPQGQTRLHPPQWMMDLWAQYRFDNGVGWSHPDPMHFEFNGTPKDAAILVGALATHHVDQTPPPVPPTAPPVATPAPPAPHPEEDELMILRELHFPAPRPPEVWLFDGMDRTIMHDTTHRDAWTAQGVQYVVVDNPIVTTAILETTRER